MTDQNSLAEKIRLQVDLSAEQVESLNMMMKDCGISTRKDLFNNAMTLFEWAVEEVKKGNIITALNTNSGTYAELRMPALSHAARWRHGDNRERRALEPTPHPFG